MEQKFVLTSTYTNRGTIPTTASCTTKIASCSLFIHIDIHNMVRCIILWHSTCPYRVLLEFFMWTTDVVHIRRISLNNSTSFTVPVALGNCSI